MQKNFTIGNRTGNGQATRRNKATSAITVSPPFPRLRRLAALSLPFLLCCCAMIKAAATVVTPTMSFTETTVATLSMYDPTINCDMVAEYNNTRIKCIVYGDDPGVLPITPQAYLYAEDGYTHSATIALPSGSLHPDVAMACRDIGATSPLLYQAVVTYTVGTELYVDVYDLSGIGYTSFAINSTPTYRKIVSSVCNPFPHIDMWVDYSTVPYLTNLWSLHKFAVVYSEGSSALLKGYVNDAASWSSSAGGFVIPTAASSTTPVYSAMKPDVACQLDGSGNQVFYVAYEIGTPPVTSVSGGLRDLRYDYTAGATSTGPTTRASGAVYAPRIEAIGDFSTGVNGVNPEYEIVYSVKATTTGVYDEVRGIGPSGTVQYISLTDFPGPYSCMSACVAAGPTVNNSSYPNIGNIQYTAGFYPYQSGPSAGWPDLYEREIDYSTGALSVSGNTYQANTNPVNFYWDYNRNMAVSNTSNYGADILTAYYNGADVVWKISSPDVMAFRMIHTGGGVAPEIRLSIAPNPATDALRTTGLREDAGYLITDAAGRCVRRGVISTSQSISVASLPNGHYAMRIMQRGKDAQTFPFIKQ